MDFSKELSLADLADMALENNPSTKEAWANAKAYDARKKQAQSAWYPTVTASGYVIQKKQTGSNKAYNYNELDYGPAGKLTYLLFDLGGRSATVEEKTRVQLAANFQFNKAVQDLLVNVGKMYYALYSAEALVTAAEIDMENARVNLNAANDKFIAGVVSKLDLLQAESDYYNYLYALESAKGAVKTAKADLAEQIGVAPDEKFRIAIPERQAPLKIVKYTITEIIEYSLKRRPDISAARAQVLAKQAAVIAANSDLWPTVNFETNTERNLYYYHNSPKNYGDDFDYAAMYFTVSWDIFDGFNKLNIKRQAQYKLKEEREKLIEAELAASSDVWTKYFNYKTAVKKFGASASFLRSSKAYYELALEGYKAGLKSMLDLTNAFSNLSEARSKMIASKKDVFVSFIELVHAVGILNTKEDYEKGDKE